MADIPVSAYVTAKASASGAVAVRNARLQSLITARATSSGALSVRGQRLGGSGNVKATASGAMTVRGQRLWCRAAARATSSAAMLVNRRLTATGNRATATARGNMGSSFNFSASVRAVATAKACLDRGRDAIGLCEVLDDIVALWGFTNASSAPHHIVARALIDLNSALQTVWNIADERNYWSNETVTVSITAAATSADLSDNIQNVTGTCRLASSRRPLVPIGTLGELETFAAIYLDGGSTSQPVAYHIERQKQAGNDPAKCTFHVTPAPAEDTDFLLEVVKEAPRFGVKDFPACPRIPIPHRYVESLLLPIARFKASSCYLFDSQDKKPAIDAEYAMAMGQIGMADPLPGNSGDNKPERREVAK